MVDENTELKDRINELTERVEQHQLLNKNLVNENNALKIQLEHTKAISKLEQKQATVTEESNNNEAVLVYKNEVTKMQQKMFQYKQTIKDLRSTYAQIEENAPLDIRALFQTTDEKDAALRKVDQLRAKVQLTQKENEYLNHIYKIIESENLKIKSELALCTNQSQSYLRIIEKQQDTIAALSKQ